MEPESSGAGALRLSVKLELIVMSRMPTAKSVRRQHSCPAFSLPTGLVDNGWGPKELLRDADHPSVNNFLNQLFPQVFKEQKDKFLQKRQSINLGSAEEELRCLREALTAPDPEALFQASSKMARVVSEYFPSEQATDFTEATLGGLLSASPTCATAAGLWMKIILKECGGAMLDKVPDILAILYGHMPTIQEGSLRQFLVEAVSILAHHHQEAVISSLLSKRLPMDSDTAELWRSLGGDPLLATQVLQALIEKIKTPTRTEGSITSETEIDRHLAAAEPLSATCAIFEVVSALQSSKAVRELLPQLFPLLLQQVSQTLGQKVPLPTRSSPSEIRKGIQLPEGNPCR
ncbi:unnamed protein product, partial [Caretta caretta]